MLTKEQEIDLAWEQHEKDSYLTRKAHRDKVRAKLAEAQNWLCHYCGVKMEIEDHNHNDRYATLDHIKPRSEGGTNRQDNLIAACKKCNNERKSVEYQVWLNLKRDTKSL